MSDNKGFEQSNENVSKDSKKSEEKEKKEQQPVVSYSQLFRFADKLDVLLIILGTFASGCHGVFLTIQFVIFGGLSDVFIDYSRCQSPLSNCTTVPDIEADLTTFSYYYIGIAAGMAITITLQMVSWGVTAERQVHNMRKAYFRSILRQEMSWFDIFDSGELNTRLSDDVNKIADGIGHKFAIFLQAITGFISGYVLGFIYGWKLTLVILSVFPLIAITGGILGSILTGLTTKEVKSYAEAGSVAQEVLSSIRTVAAFGGEKKEIERYSSFIRIARAFGEKKGLATGLSLGSYIFIVFGSYSLAFWYGGKLVIDKEMTGGDLLVVFFSVLTASAMVGQSGPSLQGITTARGAAYQILAVIDRIPEIDIYSCEGIKPESLKGNINFENVDFHYPSRPNIQVLKDFNLSVSSGQRVALVGESGCGKSTSVKLLQRFYDASEGTVKIDNHDIKTLNLKWLRQNIGVVSQEPVLFATTVAENIRYGKDGATQEEIEKVAKMANAHDFLKALPEGYETLCGERGTQMSGGQKQRIAIARALLRNPRILLLDEATSALDTESESLVQEALDRAVEGRTTFVIAHRLSTVRSADMIVTIKEGSVVETGTHDELIAKNGVYKELVTIQIFERDTEKDSSEVIQKEVMEDSTFSSESQTLEIKKEVKSMSLERLHSNKPTDLPSFQDEKDKVIEEEVEPAPLLRIAKSSTTEWKYYLIGTFGAGVTGSYPFVFAILLGEILGVFQNNPDVPEERKKMEEDTQFWALLFLALAAANFIGNLLQNWMYSVAGEILTERLRKKAFECIVRQDIKYFDDPYHSTGALTANLATHTSEVKGALGIRIGMVFSTLITSIGCLLLAFISGWKLALVIVAFIPFLVFAGSVRSKTYFKANMGKQTKIEEAGKVAVEVISNIQTVASLALEERFYEKYISIAYLDYKKRKKQAIISGLCMGLSQPIFVLSNAAAFRFSGYLVVNNEMTFPEVMKTILAVQIGATFFGQMAAMAPDYLKAKVAASRLFKLFDTVPSIKSDSEEGLHPDDTKGNIEFDNVTFTYPYRCEVKVLQDFNLKIGRGQTVALVGASGSGKSTVVSLIERLYDVDSGRIIIDGQDIRSLSVPWLRLQIGIVSQEPVLFNCSIRENIAYGHLSKDTNQEEIENAAKVANIHQFISSLPEGYDTVVGDKGTLISGGQKQRIAVARALIRNPKILLLDEATSALDTESEKTVQEALDRARVGRTTLIIAHRLSTVKKADFIVVLKSGQIVEQGTHQKLMEIKGVYYQLQQSQGQIGAS